MKKFLKWGIIMISALVILLFSLPFLFKDKIIVAVKDAANKSIDARFDFKDVDISLFRSFPKLSVALESLQLINNAPFEGDTLIAARELTIAVDLISVLKGKEIIVRSVELEKARINLKVTKEGKANWYIAKPAPPSDKPGEATAFKASLKYYSIKESDVFYDDRSLDFFLSLQGLEHEGSGDFTQDLFTLSTFTKAQKSFMSYEKIPYIAGASAEIDADLEMDMKGMKFTFKKNSVKVNDFEVIADGFVAMPDTNIDMELKFSTPKTDFKTFLSMIPAIYSKDFKGLSAGGSVKLDAFLKGRYNAVSMPGFGVELKVDNGRFQYPSLPSSVKDVFVDLEVDNIDGIPDHTIIRLSRLHADIAGDVIDARLKLANPVSDPDLDLFIKGRLDLTNIGKFYPLEAGTVLKGSVVADAVIKGRLSAMKAQLTDKFSASGNIKASGIDYSGPAVPKPILVRLMDLSLDTKRFQLTALDMKTGNTDFKANGYLQNVLGYILKDETVVGELTVSSPSVDMNEWMSEAPASTTPVDTAPVRVFEVPSGIDFVLSADIGRLKYQDLLLSNVKGTMEVRDNTVLMKGVQLEMLDGSMTMNGSYSTRNADAPAIDFDLDLKDFDIRKSVEKFNTIEKMAPLAKHCEGRFGVGMKLKGTLDKHMQPVLESLNGNGKLNTSKVTVSDFEAFNRVADALKNPSWKKFEIPSMNPSFKFVSGRVYVEPFVVEINGWKTTIAGSNGFDQTIDYVFNVEMPRSTLGGAANSVIDNLVGMANSKGADFKIGDIIPVRITMKGTVKDPKIATDLNSQGAKAIDQLKAAAEAEFEKQRAALEAKAREEAERLKAEGEARLNAEKEKAMKEAERIRKDAEAKAKAKADSLKKVAEKEAKKAIDQYNPFKKK